MKKILILLFSLGCWLITLPLSAGGGQERITYTDKVTTSQLGGEQRYLTYISTDKPLYKNGENVYIRALVLDAVTRQPHTGRLEAFLRIEGPRGELIADSYLSAEDHILTYIWTVPSGLAGGDYSIRIEYSEYDFGYPAAERSIEVRAYRPPRLKTEITFLKDGYGPGENVQAICEIARAEGGIPVNAGITIQARVDEREIFSEILSLPEDGICHAEFRLPGKIEVGDGTLLFIIEDGGVTETAARTIPILLDNFELTFYPEGGELVAGSENRVYFEARFMNGKPAALEGILLTSRGKEIIPVRSEHEGRGFFLFTPQAGESYRLSLQRQDGSHLDYPLPPVRKQGVILNLSPSVLEAGATPRFAVYSSQEKDLRLSLSRKEKILAEKKLHINSGEKIELNFELPRSSEGILQATLWEGDIPLAERLLYRFPAGKIVVDLTMEQENYSPGDTVTLHVKTSTAEGNPIGATLGLRVTDDAVLKLMEKREEAPQLPAMVFLESEVMDLADANVYLDPSNPLASLQLDLLLGTQGWRRFAYYTWNRFMEEYPDRAGRMAALVELKEREKEEQEIFFFGGAMAEDQMVKNEAPAAGRAMIVEEAFPDDMPSPPGEFNPREGGMPQPVPAEKKMFQPDMEILLEEAILAPEPLPLIIYLREYAHKRRENWNPSQRTDFTETVYWNAALATDPATGKASVSFDLNDSISSFHILAEGNTAAGDLGAATLIFTAVKPFYLEPKMPLSVTGGDQLIIPLSLVNNLETPLSGNLKVKLENRLLQTFPFTIPAAGRMRKLLPLEGLTGTGERQLQLQAECGEYSDSVSRSFTLTSPGFPQEHNAGGMVGPAETFQYNFTLPESVLAGTLRTEVKVYPSPVANLTQALEALIRQPYGCFEQTSSTSYPLVMAQQYFLSHQGVDPALIREGKRNLDSAYQRLKGFECGTKGYEWFGDDPGHEALTAYGLMQFTEMQKVMQVDEKMIDRTRKWLMARKDGQGGFLRNPQALDSFGSAPPATTNAYITWALLEAGEQDLKREIEWIRDYVFKSNDSYILALGANILLKAGDEKNARRLMDHLQKLQHADGYITGAETSITRSGGQSLTVETTAIVLLAWLKDQRYAANVEKGMGYLVRQCQNGMFFSTQGTILALKAIILYDALRSGPGQAGNLQLMVDNKPFGGAVPFTPESKGVIELADFAGVLSPGRHTLSLKMEAGSAMPASVNISYSSQLPASSEDCALRLSTRLSAHRLEEGAGTEIRVLVNNISQETAATPLAIIGIPAGLEVRHAQLQEHVEAGTFAAYEIRGQELVLYWRVLKAGEKRDFTLSCLATLPGNYNGPPSRVYEYYTGEAKFWVEGLKVAIAANQ